jgi:hypothetical protein
MEPTEESRFACDVAVPDMEESRSRRLAACNADRSFSGSIEGFSESEPEPDTETPPDVEVALGGSFSSRVDRMWEGWGLPFRGGEKVLAARLTGMLRRGLGRSSLSDDDVRLSVIVGGMGDPPGEGRPFDKKPA